MMNVLNYLRARFASKKGQGMVEYGLIVGIIAVLIIGCFTFLKDPITALFTNIGTVINGSATAVK
jgi:pilus assembly protein Flp/PilA